MLKMMTRVDIQSRDGADEGRMDELVASFGAEDYAGASQMGASGNMGYERIVHVEDGRVEEFVGQMKAVAGVEEVRVVGARPSLSASEDEYEKWANEFLRKEGE